MTKERFNFSSNNICYICERANMISMQSNNEVTMSWSEGIFTRCKIITGFPGLTDSPSLVARH